MAAEPAVRRATYADVLAAPEHHIAQVIDGQLDVQPRPAGKHARSYSVLGGELVTVFGRKRGGGPGGWWIIDEPELHLGPEPDILVPDIAGWRRERLPEYPTGPFVTLPPDWACEILSPSTHRLDRVRKMPIYAREGVRYVWLVDPDAETLEAYRLEGSAYLRIAAHGENERARIEPFEALELDLAELWGR
jgi:Uma2 family endonuclease